MNSNLKKLVYLLIICLAIVQCKDENTVKIKLDNITPLEPISVSHHDHLWNVLSMQAMGDKYVVSFYRDSLFLGILDKSMNILHRFGRRGRAGNELLAPSLTNQYKYTNNGYQLTIFERAKNQLLHYNIKNNGTASLIDAYELPRQYGDIRIAYDTSYGYWGILNNSTQDIFLYNKETSELSIKKHQNRHNNIDYQSITTANTSKSLFAAAYFSIPYIDIFSNNGSCHKHIMINGWENMPNVIDKECCFLDICSADDNIYALLCYDEDTSLLLHLDWDGHLNGVYQIAYADSLCIDKNELLCLSYDDEGLIINRYSL